MCPQFDPGSRHHIQKSLCIAGAFLRLLLQFFAVLDIQLFDNIVSLNDLAVVSDVICCESTVHLSRREYSGDLLYAMLKMNDVSSFLHTISS